MSGEVNDTDSVSSDLTQDEPNHHTNINAININYRALTVSELTTTLLNDNNWEISRDRAPFQSTTIIIRHLFRLYQEFREIICSKNNYPFPKFLRLIDFRRIIATFLRNNQVNFFTNVNITQQWSPHKITHYIDTLESDNYNTLDRKYSEIIIISFVSIFNVTVISFDMIHTRPQTIQYCKHNYINNNMWVMPFIMDIAQTHSELRFCLITDTTDPQPHFWYINNQSPEDFHITTGTVLTLSGVGTEVTIPDKGQSTRDLLAILPLGAVQTITRDGLRFITLANCFFNWSLLRAIAGLLNRILATSFGTSFDTTVRRAFRSSSNLVEQLYDFCNGIEHDWALLFNRFCPSSKFSFTQFFQHLRLQSRELTTGYADTFVLVLLAYLYGIDIAVSTHSDPEPSRHNYVYQFNCYSPEAMQPLLEARPLKARPNSPMIFLVHDARSNSYLALCPSERFNGGTCILPSVHAPQINGDVFTAFQEYFRTMCSLGRTAFPASSHFWSFYRATSHQLGELHSPTVPNAPMVERFARRTAKTFHKALLEFIHLNSFRVKKLFRSHFAHLNNGSFRNWLRTKELKQPSLEIGDELVVLLASAMLGCVFYLIPGYIGHPTRDNEIKVFFHLLEPCHSNLGSRPHIYLVRNRDCGTIFESTMFLRTETPFTTGAKVRYNFQPRLHNVYTEHDADNWVSIAPEPDTDPISSQDSGNEGPPPLVSPQQTREVSYPPMQLAAGSLQLTASMSGMETRLPRKPIPDIIKQLDEGNYPRIVPPTILHTPFSDAIWEELYDKFDWLLDADLPMQFLHSDGSTAPWPSLVQFFARNQETLLTNQQTQSSRYSANWIDVLVHSILKREMTYIRLMQHFANLLIRANIETDPMTRIPKISEAISPLFRTLYPLLNRVVKCAGSFQRTTLSREPQYSQGEIVLAQGIRQLFDSLFLNVDPLRVHHLIYKAIATSGEIDVFDNNDIVRKMLSAFADIKSRVQAAGSLFSKGEPTGIPSVDELKIRVTLTDGDEDFSTIVAYFRKIQTHSTTTFNTLTRQDIGLFTGNNHQSN
jgi:hypothetical protein